MKIEKHQIVIECSDRALAFSPRDTQQLAFAPDAHGCRLEIGVIQTVSPGWNSEGLTRDERAEIAAHMIERWTAWIDRRTP